MTKPAPTQEMIEHAALLAARQSSDDRETRAGAQTAAAGWTAESADQSAAWEQMLRVDAVLAGAAGQLKKRFPDAAQDARAPWLRSSWRWATTAGIAACTLLVAAAAWWMWQARLDAPIATMQYATRQGQQLEVTLPDGSGMTLNTGTQARMVMTRRARTVELASGDAIFRVQSDHERPFVVETPGFRATALGTVFGVTDLPHRKEVFVLEGRVGVSRGGASEKASVLVAGDVWRAQADGPIVEHGQAQRRAIWSSGRLLFENERLEDVLREMGRYRSLHFTLAEPRLGDIRMSGVFAIAELDSFASVLPDALPVTVVKEPRGWRVEPLPAMRGSAELPPIPKP